MRFVVKSAIFAPEINTKKYVREENTIQHRLLYQSDNGSHWRQMEMLHN